MFEASGPARKAYGCVPRTSLSGFIDELEDGALDDAIAAYLALPSRRRVLSAHQQTRCLGVYDQMGAPAGLLAPERDPQTGHHESARRAKRALARPGKRNGQENGPPKPAPRLGRKAAAIGAGVALLLAGGGVAAAVVIDGGPRAGLSFQPSALSFPNVSIHASVTRPLIVTNNRSSPVTVTRIRIIGPSRHDFSVPAQDSPGLAHRSGQAIRPAAQPPPPCLRRLPPAGTCKIKVAFTPSALGRRTADLRIYLTSRLRPQDIAVTGTGIPSSHRVSVSGISPASGTTAGGTAVTITGSGFTAATGVTFGTTKATAFTIDSGTQITATSPPSTTEGTVDIRVITPAATSAITTADQYTYFTPRVG